jgi:hypothetical protein
MMMMIKRDIKMTDRSGYYDKKKSKELNQIVIIQIQIQRKGN